MIAGAAAQQDFAVAALFALGVNALAKRRMGALRPEAEVPGAARTLARASSFLDHRRVDSTSPHNSANGLPSAL
jgi:hypothetical protein